MQSLIVIMFGVSGNVAQLVRANLIKDEVWGSNPLSPTKILVINIICINVNIAENNVKIKIL